MEIFAKNKSFSNYEYNLESGAIDPGFYLGKNKIPLYKEGIKPLGEANSDDLNLVLKEITLLTTALYNWIFPLNLNFSKDTPVGNPLTLVYSNIYYEGSAQVGEEDINVSGYNIANLIDENADKFISDVTKSLQKNINEVINNIVNTSIPNLNKKLDDFKKDNKFVLFESFNDGELHLKTYKYS